MRWYEYNIWSWIVKCLGVGIGVLYLLWLRSTIRPVCLGILISLWDCITETNRWREPFSSLSLFTRSWTIQRMKNNSSSLSLLLAKPLQSSSAISAFLNSNLHKVTRIWRKSIWSCPRVSILVEKKFCLGTTLADDAILFRTTCRTRAIIKRDDQGRNIWYND